MKPEHMPAIGDAVEVWLLSKREEAREYPGERYPDQVIDELLDEYRIRADAGLSLADDFAEASRYLADELDIVIDQSRSRLYDFLNQVGRDQNSQIRRFGNRHVQTATVSCSCGHDRQRSLCWDHGEPLRRDAHTLTTTCDCPKPL